MHSGMQISGNADRLLPRLHDDGKRGSHRCLLEHHTKRLACCSSEPTQPICARIMRSLTQMNQVREQKTPDPSHTNSPSAKTPNNDEAVRHDSAP